MADGVSDGCLDLLLGGFNNYQPKRSLPTTILLHVLGTAADCT